MKCPYCKTKGAGVHGPDIVHGESIHSSISCVNPFCTAYDPIRYGPHPEMTPEKANEFAQYMEVVENESDFEIVTPDTLKQIKKDRPPK